MSVNKVILIGRLGQDPEYKEINDGALAKFSVATSKKFKNKFGEKQEETQWHNIVVWGKLAKNCSSYLSKGSLVYIEGMIKYKNYEDKDGNKKYFTEIVGNDVQFLDNKQNNSVETQERKNQQLNDALDMGANIFGTPAPVDPQGDIPF